MCIVMVFGGECASHRSLIISINEWVRVRINIVPDAGWWKTGGNGVIMMGEQ